MNWIRIWNRTAALALLGALSASPLLAADTPAPSETAAVFRSAAAQLPFLDVKGLLENDPGLNFPTPVNFGSKDYFKLLNPILNTTASADALRELSHDSDPKVRTLAIAVMFVREDPKLLPAIRTLADDNDPSFPGYQYGAQTWNQKPVAGFPESRQTVGWIASSMLGYYLRPAGYAYGVKGSGGQPGFDQYWELHKSLPFCASWFQVKLLRANRGILPTQKEFIPDIKRVRKQIDQLPAPDRYWTLLYLHGEPGSDVLASDADLVTAAKHIGPKRLLLLLQEKPVSRDPDLQRGSSSHWPVHRMMGWVLEHARQVLLPNMSDDLLRCEKWERDYALHKDLDPFITADWAVGAAVLQPSRASLILKGALTRFNGIDGADQRLQLMAGFADVGNLKDYAFVSQWFFDPTPESYFMETNFGKQAGFLRHVVHEGASPGERRFVAKLLQDPRLDMSSYVTIEMASILVNLWTGTQIVDLADLHERELAGQLIDVRNSPAMIAARAKLRAASKRWLSQ